MHLPVPNIVISCGDPGGLANGIQFGTDFTFNKTVSFQCNPGFLMEPPMAPILRCTQDGSWTHGKPRCKGKCRRVTGYLIDSITHSPQPSA